MEKLSFFHLNFTSSFGVLGNKKMCTKLEQMLSQNTRISTFGTSMKIDTFVSS